MKNLWIVLVCLLVGNSAARAQLLFDNGVGNPASGFVRSDQSSTTTLAGNIFTPTLSGVVDHVVLNGVYTDATTPLSTDSFTVSLYSISGGHPAGVLGTANIESTRTALGFLYPDNTYHFSGGLVNVSGSFALTAGTDYFLSITNYEQPYGNFAITKSADGPAKTLYASTSGGPLHQFQDGALQFQLSQGLNTAAVPEPSSWALALLVVGLLVFCVYRQRKLAVAMAKD